jgi:prepilin-type processing-associated H-X9-DG protein
LSQLIIAVHNYEMTHGVYPPGTINPEGPILNQPQGYHHNWIIQLLPYLEQDNAYQHIDRSVGVYDPKNAQVRKLTIQSLLCPSATPVPATSNYAAVYHDAEAPIDADNNGVFFLNSAIGYDQVRDGSASTLYLGEKVIDQNNPAADLGWMSGTSATLRNTGVPINVTGMPRLARPRPADEDESKVADETAAEDQANGDGQPQGATDEPVQAAPAAGGPGIAGLPVGGFSSFHAGGANFAFGDGRVTLIADVITPRVYRLLGNRADGQLLDGADY